MGLLAIKLCADDYGLTPAVSRGILKAAAARRLTATSAIVTRPDWRNAAAELRSCAGEIEIGLHLNLTLGAPLTSAQGLAPSGRFREIRRLIAAARRNELPLQEIRSEIARQLDCFEQALGRAPDFVDGHQHVQMLTPIRAGLIAELRSRPVPRSFWLRDSTDHVSAILRRQVEWPKALAVAWLGRGFRQAADAAGIATNEGFSGFSSFAAGRDYAADFGHYLMAPGTRHLVMCHPGHVDEALAALDPATVSREHELAFLLSNQLPEVLAARGMMLAVRSMPVADAAS